MLDTKRSPGPHREGECHHLIGQRAALWLTLVAALSGCGAGGNEFEVYRQSYALQFTEGERVVERLGAAERKLWRRVNRQERSRRFSPDDARYLVNVGDPPLAASVRASLVALRDYNNLLADLSSGSAGTRFATGVSSILGNLNVARLQVSSAKAGPEEVAAAAQVLSPPIQIVFNTFAREASKGTFRTQLAAAYPEMRSLLNGLRSMTTKIFEIIVTSDADVRGIPNSQQAAEDKKMLASWVILIDSSLETMKAASDAVQRRSSMSAAALNDASIELRVLSEQIRTERMKAE